MKKPEIVYVVLLGFIAAGVLIDWFVWGADLPPFTPNDLMQVVGIVVLVAMWQIADAERHGHVRGRAAKWLTVLFVPVGLAIYLFQTRSAGPAVLQLIGFIAGLFAAAITADFIGLWVFG